MNITIGSAIHPVIHYKKMESELMIYSKETSIQIQKSRKTKNTKKMSVKRRMSSLAIAMLKQICQYITKTTLEIKKKWKGMKEETKQSIIILIQTIVVAQLRIPIYSKKLN